MKQEYVTIWSKGTNSNLWLVERTHSLEYAKKIMGVLGVGEIVTMPDNRQYVICIEGYNPNKYYC